MMNDCLETHRIYQMEKRQSEAVDQLPDEFMRMGVENEVKRYSKKTIGSCRGP